MIATLRLFSSRAPTLIKGMFGVGSIGDGFSLDSLVVQCAVNIPYYEQVAIYLSLPIAIAVVPAVALAALYWFRRHVQHVGLALSPPPRVPLAHCNACAHCLLCSFVRSVP